MAQNVYFEAKSEPLAGQYAVADVVLNRVQDTRYPNTICEVVREGPIKESWKTRQHADLAPKERIYHPIKNRCQFSWYCDGKSDEPKDSKTWIESIRIADIALNNNQNDITEGSLWYHATYITPYWADHLTEVITIEDHRFYK